MKYKHFWIFTLTAMLDIIVAGITIEVLAMVYLGKLVIESIIAIICFVPTILGTEYVIKTLKKNEELI